MQMVYLNKSNTVFCEQTLISETKLRLAFHMFLLRFHRLEYTVNIWGLTSLLSYSRGTHVQHTRLYPWEILPLPTYKQGSDAVY